MENTQQMHPVERNFSDETAGNYSIFVHTKQLKLVSPFDKRSYIFPAIFARNCYY